MLVQKVNIDEFEVSCINKDECLSIAQEIFERQEYLFSSPKATPAIIDCGSHIGLATLYFKKLFPFSKITCVEPVPENFALLRKNIEANHLQSVNLINAAISEEIGKAVLFGEFGKQNPRFCGSSLVQNWANPGSNSLMVETITLSSLIDEKVDFLKLDIEGLENKAISEVESKLHRIAQICIEFHGMNARKENSLDEIVKILERNNFDVEVKHKIAKEIFPPNLLDWIETAGLNLATIHAKNRQWIDG